MMKKLFATILTIMLMLSPAVLPSALAASDKAIEAAETLHSYGLLNGSGTNADGSINYDLDRAPNRYEAVTMLVRLLGKEEEAKNQKWETPFTDLVEWAKPYVGYAYNNGLTSGISATTFGGDSLVNVSQYLTFVLRALGYSSEADFSWNKAWELTDKLGITNGEYNASSELTRGDVAIISESALKTKIKDGDATLVEFFEVETEHKHMNEVNPKYIKLDGAHNYVISESAHESSSRLFFTMHDGILYADAIPDLYQDYRKLTLNTLVRTLAISSGLYEIVPLTNNSIIEGYIIADGRTIPPEEISSDTIVVRADDHTVKGYTYEYNGKSISTPDFTESEKTIDGVHFIKMDDTYLVNVNDFLAYFGIDKTLSLETLDGEYCLVIE